MDNLADGLMEAKMMIRRTRIRLEAPIRTREEITKIVFVIKIIEIREEEEEVKELEEEAFMEIISTIMKKGIEHLNVINTNGGMIEEMNGKVEL